VIESVGMGRDGSIAVDVLRPLDAAGVVDPRGVLAITMHVAGGAGEPADDDGSPVEVCIVGSAVEV